MHIHRSCTSIESRPPNQSCTSNKNESSNENESCKVLQRDPPPLMPPSVVSHAHAGRRSGRGACKFEWRIPSQSHNRARSCATHP
eukprot:6189313-Prymnesium_polylepis.1